MSYITDGTRRYTGQTPLYQGSDQSGDGFGDQRSLIGFDMDAILDEIGDGTITSLTFNFRVEHWWYGSGGKIRFGWHNLTSAPSVWPSPQPPHVRGIGDYSMSTTGFATVDLLALYDGDFVSVFTGGGFQGLILGPANSTSPLYYMYMYGCGSGHEPYLQIEYTPATGGGGGGDMQGIGSSHISIGQSSSATVEVFGSSTCALKIGTTGDALVMANTLPLPDIKTDWLNGDDHDVDTLNAQWRDPMLWLLKDTCPQLHAEYDGTSYNLTSPQAMKFDTVTMQRGDIQFTPGDTKIYIAVPGLYEGICQGAVQLSSVAATADFATEIRINGSTIASRMDDALTTESGLQTGVQGFGGHFFSVRLGIGDYIELVIAGSNWGTAGKVKSSDISVNSTRYGNFIKLWWAGI
jgi:hypothetical protein